ncbi:MAG: hypothetical protein C9356_18845 [Oleiphilus sp.]|nr:MAG: hypothetical protein C9356_18845 [Oleiphilus sp.]
MGSLDVILIISWLERSSLEVRNYSFANNLMLFSGILLAQNRLGILNRRKVRFCQVGQINVDRILIHQDQAA